MVDGKEVLGLRLNFEKRWITLAPIATVVGLAFRLFDPDHLLGEEEDRGITLALVPRNTAGMEIGRRHHPIGSPFLNGPIKGKDVFVPLDTIIGGTEMIGQGWRMLVECLSIGRCITLPSGASGTMRYALGWTGGFGRIRRQFNVPVVEMEGVQEPWRAWPRWAISPRPPSTRLPTPSTAARSLPCPRRSSRASSPSSSASDSPMPWTFTAARR